jgi:hypothetical protein
MTEKLNSFFEMYVLFFIYYELINKFSLTKYLIFLCSSFIFRELNTKFGLNQASDLKITIKIRVGSDTFYLVFFWFRFGSDLDPKMGLVFFKLNFDFSTILDDFN